MTIGGGPAGGDAGKLRITGALAAHAVASPGPPVVLLRGEPVEITLVNRPATNRRPSTGTASSSTASTTASTAGVGWGRQVAPMVAPGDRFIVRITPPRAGTFIYHTHLHDYRQLSSGLYGPLIVIEPGETFDPATDHVIVLGRLAPRRPRGS